jgi:tellurite methyltransferase
MPDKKQQWNERYLTDLVEGTQKPALVLSDNAHLLPERGKALDLACGVGGNALFMAQRGLQVVGWDYSSAAIDKLKQFAVQQKVKLQAEVRDVTVEPLPRQCFDVIVVSHFLDRSIISDLIDALKPGGLIFYQTFIQEKVNQAGPTSPDFLLKPNELLKLFSGLRILVYREEALVGNVTQGFRNEAFLVAQR